MTTYAWPSTAAFRPERQSLRIINNNRSNVSAESGVTQTLSRPGARWGWTLDMPAMTSAQRAEVEGFLAKLNGMEHRISLHDLKRPVPRGTCNTSGVTVSVTASVLATSIVLTGCGANATLLAGDWIKFATGQLVMVTDDATANGSGVMTVNFSHPLRAQVTSTSAVTLSSPTGLYVLTNSTIDLPRSAQPWEPPFSLELVEVFS